MTNAEYFLKDKNLQTKLCNEIGRLVDNTPKGYSCELSTFIKLDKFFDKEITPTLTEDERVILRNINKINYQFIGRRNEPAERLYLAYIDKGEKKIEEEMTFTYAFNQDHLFQFIKERRRIQDKRIIRRVKI